MSLNSMHLRYGATLAQDGIPLHYDDLAGEYEAALKHAVLLDRSHEGRLILTGSDRFELLNRISTNQTIDMNADEGRPTIFTNANARIIDRVVVYNRDDHLLMLTEPGQADAMQNYLQRNIFFRDDVQLDNITPKTHMFALHGAQADAVMADLGIAVEDVPALYGVEHRINGATLYAVRRKAVSGTHWAVIVKADVAEDVYEAIMAAGEAHGLRPSGGITYNTLRIRAGRPARPELNTSYIPLEIGLWDEVHFAKGCYTGQEIIARMESRGKLAKTMVALELATMVNAPADVFADGRSIGKLTSSVQAPDGDIFAIAVIKTRAAVVGTSVQVGDDNDNTIDARVLRLLGEQPDSIVES